MRRWYLIVFFLLVGMGPSVLKAEIKLPQFFSDHMVLQRDIPIPIWGKAIANVDVQIQLGHQAVQTTADSLGNWKVALASMPVGGPYQLTVSTTATQLQLKDVWLGDVYLCAGQSNMEWPVKDALNGGEELKAASFPRIRLFEVQKAIARQPMEDTGPGKWTICQANTIKNFSAVAYFFGRELTQSVDVPIGLIHASWGGAKIKPWISPVSLASLAKFQQALEETRTLPFEKMTQKETAAFQKWVSEMDSLDLGLAQAWHTEVHDWSNWKKVDLPLKVERMKFRKRDGVFWFKKTITLDEKDIAAPIYLNLGKIDDRDETYINGHLVGTSGRRGVKRAYKIKSSLLQLGENTITIRVKDIGGTGGILGPARDMQLRTQQKYYSITNGWSVALGTPKLRSKPYKIVAGYYVSGFYNAMIHPILPYAMKGILWYQGEADTGKPQEYNDLLKTLIEDWRGGYPNDQKPWFFLVQLPNYGPVKPAGTPSAWAQIREAQTEALSLPRTALATTIDLGDAETIHPLNKQAVGKRLAALALKNIYGKDLATRPPRFKEIAVMGKEVKVQFDDNSGLLIRDGEKEITGFLIAGANQKWYPAKAYLQDDDVVMVSSDEVAKPVAVRYAWADNPGELNLWSKLGWPVGPFRTDDWPLK